MGTRADFYIRSGRSLKSEDWIGSIAWDGYPEGIPADILNAKTKEDFRTAVEDMASRREDFTKPSDGWPWPWDDSHLTDCCYIFDKSRVRKGSWGHKLKLPNMSKLKKVTWGKRSGVIIFSGPTDDPQE